MGKSNNNVGGERLRYSKKEGERQVGRKSWIKETKSGRGEMSGKFEDDTIVPPASLMLIVN